MKYQDLRDFAQQLLRQGECVQIAAPIDPYLEMTTVADTVLRRSGPALWFSNVQSGQHRYSNTVLANLFGTPKRVALGMGQEDVSALRDVGRLLSELKEPQPPRSFKESGKLLQMAKAVWDMSPKMVKSPACQELLITGHEVNLQELPIQTCWPGDVAPLLTWGMVVTQGPTARPNSSKRQNLGIYRQQVIGRNQLIMRWLSHRGGALDFREWALAHPGQPFPLAVVIGADPATILGAVTPVPDTLSEYQFAGLLRGHRTELAYCTHPNLQHLMIPARAEIILEGFIYPTDTAPYPVPSTLAPTAPQLQSRGVVAQYQHALEGPFGDHTGYYNEQDYFPVFTVERITMRRDAIYHTTYTGKPPDEPAILGVALNEVFVPLLQKQFPEIIDFYLPPEGCSYRMAIVSIKKSYAGHAKRVMMGVWSFLRQFMYTKFIVVVDDDINTRDWQEVIWALTTRVDPIRDTTMIDHTPIDYLDFASPVSGLGSKMGIDATNKWPGETQRQWGRTIEMTPAVRHKMSNMIEAILSRRTI